ncbi:MAG: gluconate kinase, partial [Acidimicrobiia bacterium]|nr:gluconate kinase [Acidimicrobiia bacterium]
MSIGDLATTETHISQLFFTADRAYKLLKPVKLSFLDYSDRDQRLAAARKEVELNRRLAPDVYLGLGDLHENGELTDHLIIMRRMPDDRRLSTLVHDAGFSDCVRSVARAIATFHAALQPVSDARHLASAEAIRSLWSDNFANLRRQVPAIIGESDHARAETLAYGYLDTAMSVFAKRIDDGFVRDGHGDLIADDIFCLPDGPRILDCLAFRDDYRIGDVLADIGFLAMDLHRLAGPEAARDLMRWYQEFSYEHHPSSLAHHYVAYRAHVRAKVACLSYEAGDTDQAGLARRYHDLALHHLERARVRLILVGGPPGVGKTTVAEHLSAQFGCSHLMTD